MTPYPGNPDYAVTEDGRVFRIANPRHGWVCPYEINPRRNSKNGYRCVHVAYGVVRYVHRMVAETFLPNPEGKVEVAHNDGNRDNNSVTNLRWATPKENTADKFAHGTVLRGEGHISSKLSEADVLEIRQLAGAIPQRRIAVLFGIAQGTVSKIVRKERWRHVD